MLTFHPGPDCIEGSPSTTSGSSWTQAGLAQRGVVGSRWVWRTSGFTEPFGVSLSSSLFFLVRGANGGWGRARVAGGRRRRRRRPNGARPDRPSRWPRRGPSHRCRCGRDSLSPAQPFASSRARRSILGGCHDDPCNAAAAVAAAAAARSDWMGRAGLDLGTAQRRPLPFQFHPPTGQSHHRASHSTFLISLSIASRFYLRLPTTGSFPTTSFIPRSLNSLTPPSAALSSPSFLIFFIFRGIKQLPTSISSTWWKKIMRRPPFPLFELFSKSRQKAKVLHLLPRFELLKTIYFTCLMLHSWASFFFLFCNLRILSLSLSSCDDFTHERCARVLGCQCSIICGIDWVFMVLGPSIGCRQRVAVKPRFLSRSSWPVAGHDVKTAPKKKRETEIKNRVKSFIAAAPLTVTWWVPLL